MLAVALVAFTLPAAAAVIYASLRPLWAGAAVTDYGDVERTYRSIALRVVWFVLALHLLIILNMIGTAWLRPFAPRAVVMLFGLCLVAVGDALPRTRPNQLFGIRTARTLDDRALWIRLHRLGGYLAVIAGVLIALSGLLFSKDGIASVVLGSAFVASVTLAGVYVHSLPTIELTPENRQCRRRQIAWWTLRVLLAVVFFYFGITKFPGGPRSMWVRTFNEIGLGQWFRIVTGFVEAGGALLLLTPRGGLAGLVLLSAAMVGALLVHVFVIGVGTPTIAVVTLLTILVGVAVASRAR